MGSCSEEFLIARRLKYMKQYSFASRKQDDDSHVIAYSDESYVYTTQKPTFTWFELLSPRGNIVGGTPSKGKGLILLHAMTRDGLLGNHQGSEEDLKKQTNSAEYVFWGTTSDENYHKNFESQAYNNWIENRFIPAFQAKFTDKKCIFVSDNAAYHHGRGTKFIQVKGNNREQLIHILSSLKINSIDVIRNGAIVRMVNENWKKSKSPTSPSNAELECVLQKYVDDNPANQISYVEYLFKERGWMLLYTPLYTPEVQLIEKVWAIAKNYIARRFTLNRSAKQLKSDTFDAFYGKEEEKWEGIDFKLCKSVIKHCHDYCDNFIRQNTADTNTLDSFIHSFIQSIPDPIIIIIFHQYRFQILLFMPIVLLLTISLVL